MVGRVGLVEQVALTGGCAKNLGLARALQDKLGVKVITLPSDPQIAGALGAALIARDKLNGHIERARTRPQATENND
jgi:activator of 2-hydroxyglutaryl-CoA dehydratase